MSSGARRNPRQPPCASTYRFRPMSPWRVVQLKVPLPRLHFLSTEQQSHFWRSPLEDDGSFGYADFRTWTLAPEPALWRRGPHSGPRLVVTSATSPTDI